MAIAGGDTNSWDGPLVVSVTLVGQADVARARCSRRRPAGRRDHRHRPFRRQHSGPPFRFRAPGRAKPSLLVSATNCTPASTSATDCRSICGECAGKRLRRGARRWIACPIAPSGGRTGAPTGRRLDRPGPRPGRWRGFRADLAVPPAKRRAMLARAAAELRADGDRSVRRPNRTVAARGHGELRPLAVRGFEH